MITFVLEDAKYLYSLILYQHVPIDNFQLFSKSKKKNHMVFEGEVILSHAKRFVNQVARESISIAGFKNPLIRCSSPWLEVTL